MSSHDVPEPNYRPGEGEAIRQLALYMAEQIADRKGVKWYPELWHQMTVASRSHILKDAIDILKLIYPLIESAIVQVVLSTTEGEEQSVRSQDERDTAGEQGSGEVPVMRRPAAEGEPVPVVQSGLPVQLQERPVHEAGMHPEDVGTGIEQAG